MSRLILAAALWAVAALAALDAEPDSLSRALGHARADHMATEQLAVLGVEDEGAERRVRFADGRMGYVTPNGEIVWPRNDR